LAAARQGLQHWWRNQSAAVAHSATGAAQWEQCGGCGGFTGTVREWANARTFERHRLADIRVFVLGRGRRDDSVDGIVVITTTAAPMATSTAIADALLLPRMTPMATPTTLFVNLNFIYYYYLFIYVENRDERLDCCVSLCCCRRCCCRRPSRLRHNRQLRCQ
jgi:hypothetical protein